MIQLKKLLSNVDLLCLFNDLADSLLDCLWVGRAEENVLNLVRYLFDVLSVNFMDGIDFLFFGEEEVSFIDDDALESG